MAKDKNFKENYQKLEEIVAALSDENKDIDESIALFKEGITLYKECKKKLDDAEQEVVKILEEAGEETEYEG